MDSNKLRSVLQIGETIAVEFKRCGNKIENDVYQTVCSFLNRFGGDIYLGVEGDIFKIFVPLDEDYSYENKKNGDKKRR